MAAWLWHRYVNRKVDGITGLVHQERSTEGMTPPPGQGWTLVPGQIPAGRVEDGTGTTKRQSRKPPRTRVGEYDSNGVGKVSAETRNDTGGHRPRRATTKFGAVKPGGSAVQRAAGA